MFNGYLKKKTVVDIGVLLACLGIVMLLAKLYHPSNLAMHKVSPHPFFIISIVYSAYHGLRFSILSSIVTALLYYALLAYQVDFEEVESIFTGGYLVLPLTTAIVSIVIGDIRQRTWSQQLYKQKELIDAQEYVNLLKKEKDILDKKLKEVKSRLVTKLDTVKSLYSRARSFYSFRKDSLFIAFKEALKEDCGVEELNIYLVDEENSKFSLWGDSDQSGDSNLSHELKEILYEVEESRETFSIRELLYKKDFNFEKSPCLIALPIFKDSEVVAIVVISKMPFLKLTPTNLSVMKMICAWFGDALFFSERYASLKSTSLISRDDLIHRRDFFQTKYRDSRSLSHRMNINLSVVGISWIVEGFEEKELLAFRTLLAKSLTLLFEGLEIIGEGKTKDSMEVLLFRDVSESEKFLDDLRSELKEICKHSQLNGFPELSFSFLEFSSEKEERELL